MNYPVTGAISMGKFVVSSEDDLIALHTWLTENVSDDAAYELAELYPSVFIRTWNVTMTQEQVDILHLLLGHISSKAAFDLDRAIEGVVSPEAYEQYDRVTWTVDSEDGLNIKID